MERQDKILIKATKDEVKEMVKLYIIEKYPTLATKPIIIDSANLMASLPDITIEIESAPKTTITLP